MYVTHRSRNVGVSHQLFESREVHPGHRGPRSERVAVIVKPERWVDVCRPQRPMVYLANGGERLVVVWLAREHEWPFGFEQFPLQEIDCCVGQRNIAPSEMS